MVLTETDPQYYPEPDIEVYHTGNMGEYLVIMPNGDRTCIYQGMVMYEEPVVQGRVAYEFALDLWRKQEYEKWTKALALERWAADLEHRKRLASTAQHPANKLLYTSFMDFINRHFPDDNTEIQATD